MNETDEVSVSFSGGADSMLAAALMCKQFRKVHLLTFVHSLMSGVDKPKIGAQKLRERFGRGKITHKYFWIEDLFRKIYYGNFVSDLRKYKTYVTACFCGACRLAMHTKSIIYDAENTIRYHCDGSNRSGFGIAQMEWIMKETKKLFDEQDIKYETPIYDITRTDSELYELGLLASKDMKFPYAGYRKIQQVCCGGWIHNIYLRGYYLPLFGIEAHRSASITWWKDKMKICRNYIQDSLCRSYRKESAENRYVRKSFERV